MVLVALLVFALLVSIIGVHIFFLQTNSKPDVFVGVDVGYGNANSVYAIANAVSGYANLIILGSLEVTTNTTALTNVCNFLYQKGFYFIVYVGFAKVGVFPPQGPDSSFFQMAYNRWGEKFLGAYMFDEPGGKQLDVSKNNTVKPVINASNYGDAAMHFLLDLQPYLSLYKEVYYAVQMNLFTSDYALYWYDFLSGYDIVFTEQIVGSPVNQLSISLDRGAAVSQGKGWGTIITFGPSPSEASAIAHAMNLSVYTNVTQFYNSMLLSWQNDAKYIIVFDSPGANHTAITPYGVLTTDDLNAMKNFWSFAQNHEQPKLDPVQTAYVLPKDYGYGFRGPNDAIWGLFAADALSQQIWTDSNNLLATYGTRLDIVYETRTDDIPANLQYSAQIFWNGTTTHDKTPADR